MAFICKQLAPSSGHDLRDKIFAEMVNMGWVLHDIYISFSSGGTHQVQVGDTLTGATTGATAVVADIVVTSGTWGAGTAAGYFGLNTLTGNFYSENVNEGVNNNVATVTYTYYVYKSNGEDADRLYGFMQFFSTTATVYPYAYGWWNATTHTGNCQVNAYNNTLSYVALAKYVISGNKNLVAMHRVAYLGYWMLFGHIPKRFYAAPLATLQAPVTPGDGKTLTLDNVDMFIQNQTYWIQGCADEGKDRIKVTSVDTGALTITGDGLTIGFAAGAYIGACPTMFGIYGYIGYSYYFGITFDQTVGTYVSSPQATITRFVGATLSPDRSLGYATAPLNTPGLYVLQPVFFYSYNDGFPIGYSDEYVLYPTSAGNDYIYGVTANGQPLDTGTATDASINTLTCAGKTWDDTGNGEFEDKTVVIVSGTGAGYTRRIVSNTATILTVNTNWDVTPNTTSIFYIVDEVYRVDGNMTIAYREYI